MGDFIVAVSVSSFEGLNTKIENTTTTNIIVENKITFNGKIYTIFNFTKKYF